MGNCRRRWLVSGKRQLTRQCSALLHGIKGGNDILLCSLIFVHGSWGEVSAKKIGLLRTCSWDEENLQTSLVTDTPSLPNPIMAVFANYMLSLSFLLQRLICQTRKFKFMKGLCHLHHSLSSLGATACHFIYLGNCIGNGRNYHFIFEFPRKSRLHLAEVV